MPTRWLSIRKRNPFLHNDSDFQQPEQPQEFDFAFGEPSPVVQPTPSRVGPRLVQLRPTTAGASTGKRKPRAEVPPIRPLTSDNHKPSPLQNANGISKPENNFIGLAFGSPGHPPAFFYSPESKSPAEQNSLARHPEFRDKISQMQSKRWRKFGTLFKGRANSVRRNDGSKGPTIGLPTGFTVLDKEPMLQTEGEQSRAGQSEQSKHKVSSKGKDQEATANPTSTSSHKVDDDSISRPSTAATATDPGSIGDPYDRPPLPKLELEIPRNLDAAKRSSSLLARRSRTLDSLKSPEISRPTTKATMYADHDDTSKPGSKPGSAPLTPLLPPRRLTTPTMSRSPAASKYSLFPTTSPAPVKIVGRIPNPEEENSAVGRLKRSATSPARLSPMQNNFPFVPKPDPLYHKRVASNEQIFPSPEETTASTDREAPWSSAHSFQSSVSSATTVDEIFFDIKSFRDSKGVEDGQFVMTRPDSVQVELARTRSKRTVPSSRLRQMEAATTDTSTGNTPLPPEPPTASTSSDGHSGSTTKRTSVNTAYFDEAIAAVERLTTPTSILPSADRMPSIPTVSIANHDERPQLQISTVKPQPSKSSDHQVRLTSKSHTDVSRLIPSPVVEVKEDESPRSDATPAKKDMMAQNAPQAQLAKAVSPRMAAMKNIDRPIDDSPTIPQGPPSPKKKGSPPVDDKPPPVPKKDSKFIPMSKYAPKGTVKAIEQRSGVTPSRPTRANTEDLGVVRTASPPVRGSKERAATMPTFHPLQSHQLPQNSSLRGLERTIPPRPNPVALNPTVPEVAIARTVSLSRKQSARVNVPGPRLAARRAEAQTQELKSRTQQLKVPSHSNHHRNASAASQKSTSSNKSAKSFLGHRHKRTASSTKPGSRTSKDFSSKAKVTKSTADGKSGAQFGKFLWSKESEKQMIKEARKWEILEKKSYSPVVVQAERGHRPGVSVAGLVVEST